MSTPASAPPAYPLHIPAALDDPIQERARRKHEFMIACRLLAKLNLAWGTAGHITVRDSIREDCFWVNGYGRHFGVMTEQDLILVDDSGKVIEGDGILNPASFAVHAAIHRARPEVLAAVHGHPLYGKTWASLGRLLDPVSQDSCAFFEDHAVLDMYSGIVLSEEEGEQIISTLGARKALIMHHHGLLTVGETIESAVFWFISLENACQVQLMAEAAGGPVVMPVEIARKTSRAIGREPIGYFGYRNLRQQFLAEHSNLEARQE